MLSVTLLTLAASTSLAPATTTPAVVQQGNSPVQIWLSDTSPAMGDRVRVQIRTDEDGYLLVLHAEADGRVRVLFPLDPGMDNFVRGRDDIEIRGRGDRDAIRVYTSEGIGSVYAAFSRDPFQWDAFVRGDHWNYGLADTWRVIEDDEVELTDLVLRMAGGSFFDYDLLEYQVRGRASYGSTTTTLSFYGGVAPAWGVGPGWGWGAPAWGWGWPGWGWGSPGWGWGWPGWGWGWPGWGWGPSFGVGFGFGFGVHVGVGFGWGFAPGWGSPWWGPCCFGHWAFHGGHYRVSPRTYGHYGGYGSATPRYGYTYRGSNVNRFYTFRQPNQSYSGRIQPRRRVYTDGEGRNTGQFANRPRATTGGGSATPGRTPTSGRVAPTSRRNVRTTTPSSRDNIRPQADRPAPTRVREVGGQSTREAAIRPAGTASPTGRRGAASSATTRTADRSNASARRGTPSRAATRSAATTRSSSARSAPSARRSSNAVRPTTRSRPNRTSARRSPSSRQSSRSAATRTQSNARRGGVMRPTRSSPSRSATRMSRPAVRSSPGRSGGFRPSSGFRPSGASRMSAPRSGGVSRGVSRGGTRSGGAVRSSGARTGRRRR